MCADKNTLKTIGAQNSIQFPVQFLALPIKKL